MSRSSFGAFHRYAAVLLLGFASGLPLALSGAAMQAWLTVDGIDIATIGFFGLVGLPYTFKFLWAPLMDRFEPPLLGRRRGWLVLSQLALAGALVVMASHPPQANTEAFALIAVLVAFLSASQDVVVDAYRTDVLHEEERGLGSSLAVFGYRLAMVLSGGVTLVWVDPQGMGWSWPKVYLVMAAIMVGAAVVSLLLVPSVSARSVAPKTEAKNDLIGFFAVAIAVVIGYQATTHVIRPIAEAALSPLFPPTVEQPASAALPKPADIAKPAKASAPKAAAPAAPAAPAKKDDPKKKWVDLVALLLGVAFTLPLAWWAARRAKFETLNRSLASYFRQEGALAFLLFIVLYKLGDSFAYALTTPFLIKSAGFSPAEVGVVNKVIGIWMTIFGALIGGALMVWLRLYRSLLLFGALQLVTIFGFYLIAVLGKGYWGGFELPAFNWVIVSLKQSTHVDYLLLFAVAAENIGSGMGTAAFVAFLMALCNQRFTATQYAMLSAFASIGRVWVQPLSGVLSVSIGWPNFFLFSMASAVPGLLMLVWLRHAVTALSAPKDGLNAED